ncbi:MAG: MgtC/SapB family protein [Oscillospiraceae bacterium]|nr:MgtC/SapB family protein [Oscillospiraceae bacterium]
MEWYEIPLRLGLAMLFGLIIGMEREHHHRPAGIKTHIMVCMGAALVSLIQLKMIDEIILKIAADSTLEAILKTDYGRLGAQVISGIGFLGAGTILRSKGSIKGLTTASTLWVIACVGLAVGMGYYYISSVTVGFIALALICMRAVQRIVLKMKGKQRFSIVTQSKREAMNYINEYCATRGIQILNIKLLDTPVSNSDLEIPGKLIYTFGYEVTLPRTIKLKTIINDLQMEESVISVTYPSENIND